MIKALRKECLEHFDCGVLELRDSSVPLAKQRDMTDSVIVSLNFGIIYVVFLERLALSKGVYIVNADDWTRLI